MKKFTILFALLLLTVSCDNLDRNELLNGLNDDAQIIDNSDDNSIVPDENTTLPDIDTPIPDETVTVKSISVSVSVTTSSYNGSYSPKNVFAVWIEEKDSNYVKTLGAWARNYKSKLQRWYSKSNKGAEGMTDAITGASRRNHETEVITWKIDDINNLPTSDGRYIIYFELNETNGGSRSTTAEIQIGENPKVISINETANIKDISITFE